LFHTSSNGKTSEAQWYHRPQRLCQNSDGNDMDSAVWLHKVQNRER